MLKSIQVGDVFPAVEFLDEAGETIGLDQLIAGRVSVVFFYPKDETPGCTAQVCAFRDSYEAFIEAGAVLVGISSDSAASHRRFKQKHGLPFPLLSDPGGKARKKLGVPTTLGILPGRVTYIVDAHKKVRYCFNDQFNTGGHISAALTTLQTLKSEQ